MNSNIYEIRRENLKKLMAEHDLDCMLVNFPANRYYLSGFELHDGQCNESSGYLIITSKGDDYLCTDSRFLETAKSLWDEERIILYKGGTAEEISAQLEIVGKKYYAHKSPVIGVEASLFHDFYSKLSSKHTIAPADGLVEELRVIKDAQEIQVLRKSAALNHAMFEYLPTSFKIGQSEADIAWNVEKYFREHGASENSFPPIVAINQHAARPHHEPDKNTFIEENCHILIDVGARLDGYCSDQTRTFWFGEKQNPRFTQILEATKKAQALAIKTLRPGISGKEPFKIAWNHFDSLGLASAFTHSLGHGVGIEVHESPRLSSKSTDILRAGMLVTVEPGLYFSDFGGVRWEHMVLITESGNEVL